MATTLINNRLILFRGFGAGAWRYGQYLHLDVTPKCECFNKDYRDFIFSQSVDGENFFPVDKDTVGQFTGYYDGHNKPIYEGDIVKVFGFWQGIYEAKLLCGLNTFGLSGVSRFLEFTDLLNKDIEIIGNKYKL